MSAALDAWRAAWKPQDERPPSEWGHANLVIPNSARSSKFDVSATPWLREPADALASNRIREGVIMAPTGAGKTTIFDLHVPHNIAEAPGGILLALQTDPDAKEYMEERLKPILKSCPSVNAMLGAMDRHAQRKDAIIFPHLSLYVVGANMSNFQRRSVRYVYLDEVWLYKHGLVEEARKRTHDRWNQRIVLVSQGGCTQLETDAGLVDTELETAWQRTDKREWHWTCPQCNTLNRWSWKSLTYDYGADEHDIDERSILQSVRYRCPKCEEAFTDTLYNRRLLADSGSYVATNPTALPRHVGWHCNALTLYYVEWGTLAIEHRKAMLALKRGDEEPIKKFRQKRSAENYRVEEALPETALSITDYSRGDYLNGQLIDNEACRFLTVDVQRDHFWGVIRAWRPDGSSRLLWEGRLLTWDSIIDLQKQFHVKDFFVGVDARHFTDEVYNRCAQNRWIALLGDGAAGFTHRYKKRRDVIKFYSPIRVVKGSGGLPATFLLWSNEKVKDILVRLRAGKDFEVMKDASKDYHAHMFSEMKKDVRNKQTGQVTRRYVRIGQRPNHLWDCESEQTVMALIKGILNEEAHPTETPASDTPAPQETEAAA